MSLTITVRYVTNDTVAVYVDNTRWATLEYTYERGYPLFRVNGKGNQYQGGMANLEDLVIGAR